MTPRRRVALVTNTGWNMLRFRSGLIEHLVDEGCEVMAIADFSAADVEQIEALGAEAFAVPVEGSGTNPLRDLRYLLALARIYRSRRPEVVHHFSIKPVVYGSLAAKLCGVPRIVSSITGLGSGFFDERSGLSLVVRTLYRMALSGRTFAVFQNRDDLQALLDRGIVREDRTARIPGSGVDTSRLAPDPETPRDDATFIMVSRLLWTKGVGEFVEAARRVHERHPETRFLLFGGSREDYGSKNPDFVPRSWLEDLAREGIVDWRGFTPPEEVEASMRRCSAVVHPSYYPEGIPRTLIEAASAGAPIVTTDMPGCREAAIPEVSGILCPARDPGALADAMARLIAEPDLRARMGAESRRLALANFDQKQVLERLLEVYDAVA